MRGSRLVKLAVVGGVVQIDKVLLAGPLHVFARWSQPRFGLALNHVHLGGTVKLFHQRVAYRPERFHLAPADSDRT